MLHLHGFWRFGTRELHAYYKNYTEMGKHNYTARIICRKDVIRRDGTALLALQIFINKKRKVISLGVATKPKLFDSKKQRVKGSEVLNAIIHKARSRAQDIFYNAILTDTILTRERFCELYDNEKLAWDFLSWMENEIQKAKDERAPGTIKAYYKCLNRLKEFKKEISFSTIDLECIKEFHRFLKRKKYDVNTIYAYHKNFKVFINIAIKAKIPVQNPYKTDFKIKSVQTERVFLEPDELRVLLELYQKRELDDILQKCLRQFLFMCFSSLRISDCREVRQDWIVGKYLVFRPQKTKNVKMVQRVPLNRWAKLMIEEGRGGKDKRVFNCYLDTDNQQLNRNLKRIAQYAGINKKLTCHVARHTYATTFLLLGGKVEVLQQILGHTRIDATMIYVHITNQQMAEQAENFDDFF